MIRSLLATRYLLTPLREGGSLPAIVEADDDELYVMKFTGAGQGPKALIAELMAGELASMDQPERFRWLAAPRSTVIQVSPVHNGLCDDPRAALDDLFERLVRSAT